jgi:CRP/FNR family transcriptional regulator, anaerobic regulatory protein
MIEQAIAAFREYIKKTSFITEEDCALFEPHLVFRKIEARENIVVEGGMSKDISFIHKGVFRTFYLLDGKEINTTFFFEHEFLAEYDSFLRNRPSRYYIQCIEDAELITISRDCLFSGYDQSKHWERFGRIMAEACYQKVTDRMESFLFLNGDQRYKQLMETEPRILERIPLYHIASYLGLERESLSRLRRKAAIHGL